MSISYTEIETIRVIFSDMFVLRREKLDLECDSNLLSVFFENISTCLVLQSGMQCIIKVDSETHPLNLSASKRFMVITNHYRRQLFHRYTYAKNVYQEYLGRVALY